MSQYVVRRGAWYYAKAECPASKRVGSASDKAWTPYRFYAFETDKANAEFIAGKYKAFGADAVLA